MTVGFFEDNNQLLNNHSLKFRLFDVPTTSIVKGTFLDTYPGVGCVIVSQFYVNFHKINVSSMVMSLGHESLTKTKNEE